MWFYYLQTGDLESMRAVYETTKTFLMETYKFGNQRTWFDWGKEVKDTAITEVCFYLPDCVPRSRISPAFNVEWRSPEVF